MLPPIRPAENGPELAFPRRQHQRWPSDTIHPAVRTTLHADTPTGPMDPRRQSPAGGPRRGAGDEALNSVKMIAPGSRATVRASLDFTGADTAFSADVPCVADASASGRGHGPLRALRRQHGQMAVLRPPRPSSVPLEDRRTVRERSGATIGAAPERPPETLRGRPRDQDIEDRPSAAAEPTATSRAKSDRRRLWLRA